MSDRTYIGGSRGPKWLPHIERRNGHWYASFVGGLTDVRKLDRAEQWVVDMNAKMGIHEPASDRYIHLPCRARFQTIPS